MLLYACLSGMLEGLYILEVHWSHGQWPYITQKILQLVPLILTTYLSLYFNRRKMIVILLGVVSFGAGLILLGSLIDADAVMAVGILLLETQHYPLAIMQFLIVIDYFGHKRYSLIWSLLLCGLIIGRILAVPLISLRSKDATLWWL